jgi:uncharacterized damage-inducible protein DinB
MTVTCRLAIAGVLTVIASSSSYAQATAPAKPRPPVPFASYLQSQYATIKRVTIATAEKMPVEHYAFRPVPEVRTFAQILGHVVETNYFFCNAVKGGANPAAGRKLEAIADKAEMVQVVKEGFAYCDGEFAKLTDQNLTEMLTMGQPANTWQAARANQLTFVLTHSNEHYGNLVTYMRMKGIVPPSSER